MHEPLSQAVIVLKRTWNTRRPLVNLPEETLNQILSHIPDPAEGKFLRFDPHWKSESMDNIMLVPITQTCHRLREVALGNPLLWRHGCTKARQTTLPFILSRSQNVPLTIVLSDSTLPDIGRHIHDLCQSEHLQRIRELHLCSGEESDSTRQFYSQFGCSLWPALERLTIHFTFGHSRSLELVPEHMPRLRYLDMWFLPSQFPQIGFAALTHLSVYTTIVQSTMGEDFVRFISTCSSLESLVLNLLNGSPMVWGPPRVRVPLPPTVLPRLRRVIFHDLESYMLNFYVSAFALHSRNEIAVQMLWSQYIRAIEIPWDDILPHHPSGSENAPLLVMLQHTSPVGELPSLSVTAIGARTTVRVAAIIYPQLHQAAFLAGVRDVWIDFPQHPAHITIISRTLVAIPALETVTFVAEYIQCRESAGPSLYVVPKRFERPMGSSRVRTLRFVLGFSKHETPPPVTKSQELDHGALELPMKLDLSNLVAGFSTLR